MRFNTILLTVLIGTSATAGAQDLIVSRQQQIYRLDPGPILSLNDQLILPSGYGLAAYEHDGRWRQTMRLHDPSSGSARSADLDAFAFGRTIATPDFVPSGAVFMRRLIAGSWRFDRRLVASDNQGGISFGQHVAVSGNTLAVTAPRWRPLGQPVTEARGAIYIFEDSPTDGWLETGKLTLPAGEQIGSTMALDGDTLAVIGPDGLRIFRRTLGVFDLKEHVPGVASLQYYEPSVAVVEAVSGPSATVVVSWMPTAAGGTVSSFTGFGSFWQTQHVHTNAPGNGARLNRLSVTNTALAVGDPRLDVNGIEEAGAVQLFHRESAGAWAFDQQIVAEEPTASARFGDHVELFDDWLAVTLGGIDLGGQYQPQDLPIEMFRILPAGATEYCAGNANSTGSVARFAYSGSTSISNNDLELVVGPVPDQAGAFVYGAAQIQAPFGDGFNCVGAGGVGTFRLGVAEGKHQLLSQALDFQAIAATAGQILPGSTWYFQALYRDPAAGASGFNLSTGLELTFEP